MNLLRRQRGLVADLILYGVIAAAVLGVCVGFIAHQRGIGKDEQLVIDAPVLTKCKEVGHPSPKACAEFIAATITERDTAIAANQTLQVGVAECKKRVTEQNEKVDQIKKDSDAAVLRATRAQASNAVKITAYESEANALIQRTAVGLAKGVTCPKATVETTGDWHNFGTRELAERPPSGASTPKDGQGLSVQ